jgi:hypothetical protein
MKPASTSLSPLPEPETLQAIKVLLETKVGSPLLTEAEAIAYLRLDTIQIDDPAATLRRYRERGLLRGTQVSKRVFYLRDELDRFLKKVTDENPR